LHDELVERKVDLLIARRLGSIADARLSFEVLFDDSYVVVAGSQHPRARQRQTTLGELANEAWVLPPQDSALGAVAAEAFRASGLAYPRVSVVTIPPEMRMSLLTTGYFLTILPASGLRFPA